MKESATCVSDTVASLFGCRDTPTSVDLGDGCWLVHGKLQESMLPSAHEMDVLFSAMPKQREYFEMYGKPVMKPRHMKLYSKRPLTIHAHGHAYAAKQIDEDGVGYCDRLLDSNSFGEAYNAVLATWYEDGADHYGWHADREKELDENMPIVSVALGAPRRLQIRNEASGEMIFNELLLEGEAVIMGGPRFHSRFKQRVPKMIAKKDGVVAKHLDLAMRKYRMMPPDQIYPAPPATTSKKRAAGAAQPNELAVRKAARTRLRGSVGSTLSVESAE